MSSDKYLIYESPEKFGIKFVVKEILNIIERIYYSILYFFIKPKELGDYKYNVSICAIFKDEAPYLKEWIEFHKIVGVDHFYLYNNKSSDNYLEILQPYMDEGLVEIKDWPKAQSQMEAYKDFMDTKARETKWVGFIDLDEYVIPNKYDNIYDFLKKFKNKPSVIIYWKYMGSSGLINRNPNSLITETFVIGWPKYAAIGKFFFNTKFKYEFDYKRNGHMHYTWGSYKGIKLPPVNLFGHICPRCNYNAVHTDDFPIQINHYVIKTYREYIDKKSKRGGGVNPLGIHDAKYFFDHESRCQKADYHAYKYLIKLKLSMK